MGLDPGYDGYFEEKYTADFANFMGGGYADAVSSGCAGLYVALKSLNLPPKSLVATSPVTDASVIGCIVEQGHIPYLIDSMPKSYNSSLIELQERFIPEIKALVLTHAGGEPCNVREIAEFCKVHEVALIEDCSQAIGAIPLGEKQRVGSFGRYGCFSTMYRKNLSVSGSSGLVYCREYDDFKLAKQHADRGKKWWDRELVDMRDPGFAEFPGLNWNSDELRCSIGIANLKRLEITNERRRRFLIRFIKYLKEYEVRLFRPYSFHQGFSPFYFPIFVDAHLTKKSVLEISIDVRNIGLGVGVKYGCLVSTWLWAKPFMYDDFIAPNALATRNSCFHLYLNENYTEKDAEKIVRELKNYEKTILT
jgi:dTDP-4-amino-4,6-dideoxygalactose transaminase